MTNRTQVLRRRAIRSKLLPGACLLASGAVLGVAPSVAWGFTATVEMTPTTVGYYGPTDPRTTTKVVYRLHLTAGPQDERVVMEPETGVNVEPVEGAGGGTVVDGPAALKVVSRLGLVGDDFGSPGRDGCPPRASGHTYVRYEVMLPAGSTSIIEFQGQPDVRSAPLSARSFGASFRLAPTPAAGPGTVQDALPEAITVSSPTPNLLGLKASQLELRTGLSGSGTSISSRSLLPVMPGSAMRLSGLLNPARRGERVTIWDYSPGATTPVRLAIVRTDRHGKYQYLHWRPTTRGIWELYATWPGRTGLVEKARSACGGPQISVTSDIGDGKPRPPTGPRYRPNAQ